MRRASAPVRQLYSLAPLGSGVWADPELLETLDGEARFRMRAQALSREFPEAWLSCGTAARLLHLPLNRLWQKDPDVHLSFPASTGRRIVRSGVKSHRAVIRPDDAVTLDDDVRVSSYPRLWLELAAQCSTAQLVILGDYLVRVPYPRYEGRRRALASLQDLREATASSSNLRGIRKAREALGLVRVGADSPPETTLRLAMHSAGLPEPELQVAGVDGDPRAPRADLGYRRWKIAIQYEGFTHFSPEQAKADHRRDNFFLSRGWIVLRFSDADYRDGFLGAVGVIRQAIESRS